MSAQVMTASVCGIYVVDIGLVDSGLDGSVFDQFAGTGVAFLLKTTDKLIAGFQPQQSTITSFKDNKDLDLLKNAAGQPVKTRWQGRQNPLGRKDYVVEFKTRSSPSPDASQLQIEGALQFRVADGTQDKEFPNIPLEVGPLALDNLDIQILRKGVPEFLTNHPFAIKIQSKGEAIELLDSLSFLDANGQQLSLGSFRSAASTEDTVISEHYFDSPVDVATIKLSLWVNAQSVSIPIKAEIRLGISSATL